MTPSSYAENTPVFVLVGATNQFVCLLDLSTGKQWAYAFTSQDKAKAFIKVMGKHGSVKSVNRVLPCTLKEWFDWQPKKKLPDLIIDPDTEQLRKYPKMIQADFSKYNITCITRDSVNGTTYQVIMEERQPPTA